MVAAGYVHFFDASLATSVETYVLIQKHIPADQRDEKYFRLGDPFKMGEQGERNQNINQ